jgi:hypothetical protein
MIWPLRYNLQNFPNKYLQICKKNTTFANYLIAVLRFDYYDIQTNRQNL